MKGDDEAQMGGGGWDTGGVCDPEAGGTDPYKHRIDLIEVVEDGN